MRNVRCVRSAESNMSNNTALAMGDNHNASVIDMDEGVLWRDQKFFDKQRNITNHRKSHEKVTEQN